MPDERFKLSPSHVASPAEETPVVPQAAVAKADSGSATSAMAATMVPNPIPPPVQTVSLQRIFSQIRSANLWLVLLLLSFLLTWAGYAVGHHFENRYGLLIGFFTAVALNALILFYGEWRLQTLFVGRELEGQDAWGLLTLSRTLAARLKVPRAQLCEVESETPFLFSAGLFQGRMKIFYSTAIPLRFSREEMSALFARELVRAASDQTRTATSVAALANAWLTAVGLLDSLFLFRFVVPRRSRRWCPGPFTLLSLPGITLFLRFVIRRSAAFEIDRQTAEDLGDSATLARALSKLDAYNRTLPIEVNFAEAVLFAVFPLSKYTWSRWAAVQPSIEMRLHRLVGEYPL